jgi:hypothetical protein
MRAPRPALSALLRAVQVQVQAASQKQCEQQNPRALAARTLDFSTILCTGGAAVRRPEAGRRGAHAPGLRPGRLRAPPVAHAGRGPARAGQGQLQGRLGRPRHRPFVGRGRGRGRASGRRSVQRVGAPRRRRLRSERAVRDVHSHGVVPPGGSWSSPPRVKVEPASGQSRPGRGAAPPDRACAAGRGRRGGPRADAACLRRSSSGRPSSGGTTRALPARAPRRCPPPSPGRSPYASPYSSPSCAPRPAPGASNGSAPRRSRAG